MFRHCMDQLGSPGFPALTIQLTVQGVKQIQYHGNAMHNIPMFLVLEPPRRNIPSHSPYVILR